MYLHLYVYMYICAENKQFYNEKFLCRDFGNFNIC